MSVHRQKDRPQTITRSPQVRVNLEKASKPPGRTSDEVPLEIIQRHLNIEHRHVRRSVAE